VFDILGHLDQQIEIRPKFIRVSVLRSFSHRYLLVDERSRLLQRTSLG
jgi:hypothetical protein